MEIARQTNVNKAASHRQLPAAPASTIRNLKLLLTAANCLFLSLGNAGGPIFLRLYFLHGGRRQWLSSWIQTAGWPILLLLLASSFIHRRRSDPSAPPVHLSRRLFSAAVVIGLLTGLDDFLYSYGLSFLPVSTSAVLIATQLAFTAFFAFVIVRQRFTAFSVNAVALLTVGTAVLALHSGGDRPAGVTVAGYWKGFGLTLGAAALYGLVLPLVELAYGKAGRPVTYTLVMEMQLVIGFFATALSTIGVIANHDFQAMAGEAATYGLGEAKYYAVIVAAVIFWQLFFLGAVGVISCVNTLLAGIIIAVFIPVVEVLGVIFLHEKFSTEKGVALALSLWGLASYSYGEYIESKKKKKKKKNQNELQSENLPAV